ncbi:MAG TPA: hypothetical protein VLB84_00270 [Bacteroidia bacterium]|nr:hypothetical protein [Bacteroidia bacterium]
MAYFEGMEREPAPVTDITGARVLAKLGDSVTTDHISPASTIKPGTPAAQYLDENGVAGAIGNRTIGAAAAGGMFFGTVFGIIIIPGLYVIFATLAEKLKKKKTKEEIALTEEF